MPQHEWSLRFFAEGARPVSALEAAFAAACGAAPETTVGPVSGDPYNGYGRDVVVRAAAADGSLALRASFSEQLATDDGRAPPNAIDVPVTLSTPSPETSARLGAWERLATELAARGFRDDTLLHGPRPIVEEIEASGDRARGASMRRAITAALVRSVRPYRFVSLWQTCPDDLGAVLRAYERPEAIGSVSLSGLGLDALPAELARFTGATSLALRDDRLAPSALRGLSLARLEELQLAGPLVERVEADDLRGFPSLRVLRVEAPALRALDPAIVEACPRLERAHVRGSALARDEAALAALAARWPRVSLQSD